MEDDKPVEVGPFSSVYHMQKQPVWNSSSSYKFMSQATGEREGTIRNNKRNKKIICAAVLPII